MEEIRTEEKHPLGRIRADNDRKFRKKYIVADFQKVVFWEKFLPKRYREHLGHTPFII